MSDFFQMISTDGILAVPLAMIVFYLIYGWYENANRTPEQDRESRLPLYNKTLVILWSLAALSAGCWLVSGGTGAELGFRAVRPGWMGWVAWAAAGLGLAYILYMAVLLSRSSEARQQVRDQLETAELDFMRPRTAREHIRFRWLSITAGITEEIVFRGFLIAALAIVMPVWMAGVIAVLIFGLGHIYQGAGGVIRTSVIGAVFTVLYLMAGSLWPVILLHIFIDLAAGVQFQLIDEFEERDVSEREIPTEGVSQPA